MCSVRVLEGCLWDFYGVLQAFFSFHKGSILWGGSVEILERWNFGCRVLPLLCKGLTVLHTVRLIDTAKEHDVL